MARPGDRCGHNASIETSPRTVRKRYCVDHRLLRQSLRTADNGSTGNDLATPPRHNASKGGAGRLTTSVHGVQIGIAELILPGCLGPVGFIRRLGHCASPSDRRDRCGGAILRLRKRWHHSHRRGRTGCFPLPRLLRGGRVRRLRKGDRTRIDDSLAA